jgi:2-haloacid dehalogenase
MIAFGDFDVLSFDCYGTLIDWETGLVQALHPILHAHGVQQGDEEVLAVKERLDKMNGPESG